MTDYIIQTHNLSYQYNKVKKVLDQVSLHVPKGSIYGFLGPNGAGKSTTMRLLTGILPEQEQAISLFGQPLQSQLPQVFQKIGALVEAPALYLHLSGVDNLRYIAHLRHIPESRIQEALALVDLTHDGHRKVKQYSLGMKQRLAIAMALLGEPELLLLDEPVNGLDPNGMIDMRKLLIKLNQEKGITIFISSHLLSEIEKLCTHVGIISKGKLRFEGTFEALSKQAGHCKIQLTIDHAVQWLEKLKPDHNSVELISNQQLTLVLEHASAIPAFIQHLIEQKAALYEVKMLNGLEEWFLQITNENATHGN